MSNKLDPGLLRTLLIYDPETGKLFWKPRPSSMFPTPARAAAWNAIRAGKEAFATIHASGYRRTTILNQTINAHRLIYAMVYGEWPPEVDHINGIRHDNRLCNLRGVTKAENARNVASPRNVSGVCGVIFYKKLGKWGAYINRDKKRVHLGVYAEKATAVAARKRAELEYAYGPTHGRLTNFRDAPHHSEGL